MKYTTDFFEQILTKCLNYEIKDFSFCRAVEMDAVDAFRYCVLSGSGYLDTKQIERRLIIRKDLFRVFNQAEQETIQHGVFDGNSPEFVYTPNVFFEKYPYILQSPKYIVFLKYDSSLKNGMPPYYPLLSALEKEILAQGKFPGDFVVTLVPSANPKDLEPFFEYFVQEFYRRKGYLTDSQLPFYYGVGTPDAGVYKNNIFMRDIFAVANIGGASMIDLMCLRHLKKGRQGDIGQEDTSMVFEVKTGSTNGSQITKYIDKRVFDYAYEVIPHKKQADKYAGLFRFCQDGGLIIEPAERLDNGGYSEYFKWLVTYVKCFLIANLTNDEFERFKLKHDITTTAELIKILKGYNLQQLTKLATGEIDV